MADEPAHIALIREGDFNWARRHMERVRRACISMPHPDPAQILCEYAATILEQFADDTPKTLPALKAALVACALELEGK